MILVGLGISIVLGSFWLVVIYNNIVDLRHDISSAKADFDALQAQNSELRSRVFALLDVSDLKESSLGLVQDKNPEYLEINSKWSFASER